MDRKEVLDFLKDLVIIGIIVLFIRFFIAMPFQISGQSMFSSYYDREFIIVDRLSYRIGDVEKGDVIVFKPHVSKDKEYFLKRVIATPGDKIKIESGNVYLQKKGEIKYKKLDEKYLNDENKGYTFIRGKRGSQEYTLGKDQYFVMGDNRNHSTDSRECFSSCALEGKTNFIHKSDITGKVFIDLGYFNFKKFSFIQPNLGVETYPRFFDSPSTFDYE